MKVACAIFCFIVSVVPVTLGVWIHLDNKGLCWHALLEYFGAALLIAWGVWVLTVL